MGGPGSGRTHKAITPKTQAARGVIEWLEDTGETHHTLAFLCGVHVETIRKALRGRAPSLRLAIAIENATGVKAALWAWPV